MALHHQLTDQQIGWADYLLAPHHLVVSMCMDISKKLDRDSSSFGKFLPLQNFV
jgi:hypothetical protein